MRIILPKLSMRFWFVLVLAIAACLATASLGMWQLRRAAAKELIQTGIAAQQNQPSLNNADIKNLPTQIPNELMHRHVVLRGVWVAEATVFLDNRVMDKRTGFYVVTPLRLDGDGRVILVQRGWIGRDFQDRTRIPDVPTPKGIVEIRGRLAPPPSKIYDFGDSGVGRIRQNVDIEAMTQALQAELLQASLVQLSSPVMDDFLLRSWPVVGADVHKHYGYAFQWFALCALIIILYVWFQIITPCWRVRQQSDSILG
jgi:surfeit locus 1 family protein